MRDLRKTSMQIRLGRIILLLIFAFSVLNLMKSSNAYIAERCHSQFYPGGLFGSRVLLAGALEGRNYAAGAVNKVYYVYDVILIACTYLRLLGFDSSTCDNVYDYLQKLDNTGMAIFGGVILLLPLILLLLSFKTPKAALKAGAIFYGLDTISMLMLYGFPELMGDWYCRSNEDLWFVRISLLCLILQLTMLLLLAWAAFVPHGEKQENTEKLGAA